MKGVSIRSHVLSALHLHWPALVHMVVPLRRRLGNVELNLGSQAPRTQGRIPSQAERKKKWILTRKTSRKVVSIYSLFVTVKVISDGKLFLYLGCSVVVVGNSVLFCSVILP